MKQKLISILVFILLLQGFIILPAHHVLAQEDTSLTLKLNRDFGYGLGNQMQGRFSYRVSGPDDLERVVFLLDGESIGEDNEAPFRLQFQTDDYALGPHAMSAVGYTSSGIELHSNVIDRKFVSGSNVNNTELWIIIPVVVLAIGGRIIASRIANRGRHKTGKQALSGVYGGTICPNCNRPYAIHFWSLRLVTTHFDRCPHCGKWKMVHRVPFELLEAAAEAAEAADATAEANNPPPSPTNPEEKFRNQLDDSRFDDSA